MQETDSGRVLVTGGTGFIGSHLVESLIREGVPVSCLVRDPSRSRWLHGLPVTFVRGDCTDPRSLAPALRDVAIVVHVAGLTKARRPREYYAVNHQGTKDLLEACAGCGHGIRKFVLVSSLAAAGPSPDGRPVQVTDVPRPVSDYGWSKLQAEKEALSYQDRFPVVILRPSAVYGPRDTDVYELFRWASKGLFVEIAGGERFINPAFVLDVTQAIVAATRRQVPSGSVYFVAENRQYSWTEFRDVLLAAGGVRARTIRVPYALAYLAGLLCEAGAFFSGKATLTSRQKVREAAQKYWVCDLAKTESDLGFQAAYPLEKGLELTWKWYRDNGWLR